MLAISIVIIVFLSIVQILSVSNSFLEVFDVRELINKGRSLSQLHRFEEAISNYDRALRIDPQNTDAYINKGLPLYNLGKNAEAITYFDKVLAVEPNNLLAASFKHNAELNLKGHK